MYGKIPLLLLGLIPKFKKEIKASYKIGLIKLHHLLNPKAPKFSLSFNSIVKREKEEGVAFTF